ncbi:MAG: hypothetical protein IJC37_00305, partial [Clostridia bacterium]|nr:hypothetical protein [Clostridia bacterium]
HRKGRSFDSAERFFYEAILTYGEEKNASMGRKSDLCGVFSSNAVTLIVVFLHKKIKKFTF